MKGSVKVLTALIGTLMAMPNSNMNEVHQLSMRKNALLVNGFTGPQPSFVPNQRQRRKLQRQTA